MNFSGFPHIPAKTGMTSYPTTGTGNDGGLEMTREERIVARHDPG